MAALAATWGILGQVFTGVGTQAREFMNECRSQENSVGWWGAVAEGTGGGECC